MYHLNPYEHVEIFRKRLLVDVKAKYLVLDIIMLDVRLSWAACQT